MVRLNKIYTRTGDRGETGLGNGERRSKADLRVETYGTVDELNAVLGLARLHAEGEMDETLARIQNELFDLGAELATPETGEPLGFEPLKVVPSQVERMEAEIDAFVELIGGSDGIATRRPSSSCSHRRPAGRAADGGACQGRAGGRDRDALCQSSLGPSLRRRPDRQ